MSSSHTHTCSPNLPSSRPSPPPLPALLALLALLAVLLPSPESYRECQLRAGHQTWSTAYPLRGSLRRAPAPTSGSQQFWCGIVYAYATAAPSRFVSSRSCRHPSPRHHAPCTTHHRRSGASSEPRPRSVHTHFLRRAALLIPQPIVFPLAQHAPLLPGSNVGQTTARMIG